MTDANSNGERKVRSLRDLPQEARPPRDLWAGIEARIKAEPDGASHAPRRGKRFTLAPLPSWIAAAAMIATLAVGVWIGRSALPNRTQPTAQTETHTGSSIDGAKALQAAYMSDPKYREERAALVKSLEAKLASLPPDSRAKVMSSLATIHNSIRDLEAALGKDPTNALLQELLLNTYQDEMRVLTTVQDASDAGKGI